MDGTVEIYRQSPFSRLRTHTILALTNKRPGKWVADKIIQMDTTRFDIIGQGARNNLAIRNQRKSDRRLHDTIADFMTTGGDRFVL